jgi:hypothetical protein
VKETVIIVFSPEIPFSLLEELHLRMAQTLNQIRIRPYTRTRLLLLFLQNRTVVTVATGAIELEND